MPNSCNIFIIAGELSGDFHGGYLMQSLKKINLNIHFTGIGGKSMESGGRADFFLRLLTVLKLVNNSEIDQQSFDRGDQQIDHHVHSHSMFVRLGVCLWGSYPGRSG